MSHLVVGVLALQGDVREHLYALAECDALARPVRRPSELDDVDALVIPGGESTTISKLSVEFGLAEPIRKRIAGGMPAYGSCAGMIMLAAEVLDGRADQQSFAAVDMTVRRNAFGRQVDSFETPVPIAGLAGPPFPAVFIRAPWVERVGPDVTVLGVVPASTPEGSTARTAPEARGSAARTGPGPGDRIVAVRQGNLLATAFHPELAGDLRVHRLFVELAREAQAQ